MQKSRQVHSWWNWDRSHLSARISFPHAPRLPCPGCGAPGSGSPLGNFSSSMPGFPAFVPKALAASAPVVRLAGRDRSL